MKSIITALKARHQRIEELLRKEMLWRYRDESRIRQLKRRKLLIKDRLAMLSKQGAAA